MSSCAFKQSPCKYRVGIGLNSLVTLLFLGTLSLSSLQHIFHQKVHAVWFRNLVFATRCLHSLYFFSSAFDLLRYIFDEQKLCYRCLGSRKNITPFKKRGHNIFFQNRAGPTAKLFSFSDFLNFLHFLLFLFPFCDF